jgi:hypothetical protein
MIGDLLAEVVKDIITTPTKVLKTIGDEIAKFTDGDWL